MPLNRHKEENINDLSKRKDFDLSRIVNTIQIEYKHKSDDEIIE